MSPSQKTLILEMSNLLLADIGNTHIHVGVADSRRVISQKNILTQSWDCDGPAAVKKLIGKRTMVGMVFCSVVPSVSPIFRGFAKRVLNLPCIELNNRNVIGVGIDYPKPKTIGTDRLSNAMAAVGRFGAPCVVVDFGTAVTFDVVDHNRNYVGGIIAPGLSAMTTYLHEKTALLPEIKIKEVRAVIGKSTQEAMLVGAVHGYRGLVRELLSELRRALGARKLPVVFTGGYAKLIARAFRDVTVDPNITLEGLRMLGSHVYQQP